MKHVTIKDIARSLCISVSTVSEPWQMIRIFERKHVIWL